MFKFNSKNGIRLIAASAVFGALAIILYCVPYLQFSLPFAPSFLKIHLDEIPILIGGYAYGPSVAIVIIIIKSLIKLITDIPETAGIGVLCDILYTSAFVLPAIFYYKYHRNLKGAIISISIGFIAQLLMSSVIGVYIIYPLYGFYYNPMASTYEEAMNTIGQLFKAFDYRIETAMDPRVMYEFLLPFNLIKDAIVIGVTFLVYKPLRIFIERAKK